MTVFTVYEEHSRYAITRGGSFVLLNESDNV